MNISAAYLGGCSASIKTSVKTVQDERKKTSHGSPARDINACRLGRNKSVILVLLPAVNSLTAAGSVLSSGIRRWLNETWIPSSLVSSPAAAAAHQESCNKHLHFYHGERWAWAGFPACVGVKGKESMQCSFSWCSLQNSVFISSGIFKKKLWALSGVDAEKQKTTERPLQHTGTLSQGAGWSPLKKWCSCFKASPACFKQRMLLFPLIRIALQSLFFPDD